MATDTESFNRDLYNLLKVRGYNPVPLDSKNQRVSASQDSDVIEFQFTKDGEDYGKVWVTVDDAQNIIVYYDEEQQNSPSTRTPGVDYDDTWTGLLKFLKNWAQRRQMSFELANKDRLGDDMRQRDYYKMKEKLGESYHPMGKKASYNDAVPSVKIILQHNRALEEGEQRYRNVARIFLENQDGERFLAPTNKPGLARVYARHIAEGGLPNDEKWNHIKSICEDYSKMAGFVRATKNKQFNESAQELVNEGVNHYNNLRETLHKLAGHRGYQAYFESWTPTLMEGEGEDISEMFMSQSLDPRIESAMPILSRLKKPVTEMEEVDNLAEWADSIISEKLEMDEGWLDKPKFTCVIAGRKPEEFEANSKEEAQKIAAKKWGVDPKTVNVKEPEKTDSKPASEPSSSSEHDISDPIERSSKSATDKLKAGSVGGVVGTVGKIVGGALGLKEAGEESIQSNNSQGIPEGEIVPFKKKNDEEDWDDESWIPSIEDFEQEERIRNRKHKPANDIEEMDSTTKTLAVPADKMLEAPGAQTLAHNQSTEKSNLKKLGLAEMEKDLYQGRRHDPRKGPQGPDKTAKMMAAKKAMKDARKALDKAFKGDVEENFIGMAPQAVAEEEVNESYPSSIKQYASDLAKEMRREKYDWEPVDLSDPEEAIDDAREQLSMFATSNMCDFFGDYDTAEQLQIIKMFNKKFGNLEEDLGPEQKRVGQLGPTEKVKNNNIGKLVGASESKEMDPELARIIEMARFKR